MLLKIKYFGQIAEATQQEEETLSFFGTQVSELLELLCIKYELLNTKDFKIAQNQTIVSAETKITGPDIALLPPFSGG